MPGKLSTKDSNRAADPGPIGPAKIIARPSTAIVMLAGAVPGVTGGDGTLTRGGGPAAPPPLCARPGLEHSNTNESKIEQVFMAPFLSRLCVVANRKSAARV